MKLGRQRFKKGAQAEGVLHGALWALAVALFALLAPFICLMAWLMGGMRDRPRGLSSRAKGNDPVISGNSAQKERVLQEFRGGGMHAGISALWEWRPRTRLSSVGWPEDFEAPGQTMDVAKHFKAWMRSGEFAHGYMSGNTLRALASLNRPDVAEVLLKGLPDSQQRSAQWGLATGCCEMGGWKTARWLFARKGARVSRESTKILVNHAVANREFEVLREVAGAPGAWGEDDFGGLAELAEIKLGERSAIESAEQFANAQEQLKRACLEAQGLMEDRFAKQIGWVMKKGGAEGASAKREWRV